MLTGGITIQMWQVPEQDPPQEQGVEFFIDDNEEVPDWTCIWHCHPPSPVMQLKFSTDGLLFASIGKVLVFICLQRETLWELVECFSTSLPSDALHESLW